MKKLLTLILLLSMTAITANYTLAQESKAKDVIIQQVDKEVSLDRNSIYLSDELSGVFTNITNINGMQQLAVDANQVARISTTGDYNTATLTQSGNNNIGIININGSNNEAALSQNGSRLLSAINLQGSENILDVSQNGNNLQNLILLEGSQMYFDIDQTANGVKLSRGSTTIPIVMKTSSNTMPIIIRDN